MGREVSEKPFSQTWLQESFPYLTLAWYLQFTVGVSANVLVSTWRVCIILLSQ